MTQVHANPHDQEHQSVSKAPASVQVSHIPSHSSAHDAEDRFAVMFGHFFDRADTFIYAIVGICFLIAGILALGYSFWQFSIAAFVILPAQPLQLQPAQAAAAIIDLVSGLLLVLIIMEVLGTVIHYLKSHATSLRPFLFIGIVSATRSILSIGAKLSVGVGKGGSDFYNAMIELGVSAAVILALGITLKLLGRLVEQEG